MDQNEKIEALNAIVDRFYTRQPPRGLLGVGAAPFDISKPNRHDNKKEFKREKEAVESALEHVEGLLVTLLPPQDADKNEKQFLREFRDLIDSLAAKHSTKDQPDTIVSFLNRAAIDTGLSTVTLYCLIDMQEALSLQRQELADQEAEFWMVSNRPPNHYARKIALRFARAIARNTGKKPTFGIAREGNHPSTDFGRALEEVFEILKIRAQIKNAATWALGQLTEEDLKPKTGNALAAFVSPSKTKDSPSEITREIARLLTPKAPQK